GTVIAEVGRGLRERRHLERYRTAWSTMLFIQSDYRRWEQTLELAWILDRRGTVLPLQDLHIAACAAHIGAVVLTLDDHFNQIPNIDATDRIL
ncbi:MAG: PIN domain-containing protein, partial [Verrucomicrobiales bacterium]